MSRMTECSIGSDDTDGRGTIDEGTVSVEPETGGLRVIAGVLSSIFDEDSCHFFVHKSAKFKHFGYKNLSVWDFQYAIHFFGQKSRSKFEDRSVRFKRFKYMMILMYGYLAAIKNTRTSIKKRMLLGAFLEF